MDNTGINDRRNTIRVNKNQPQEVEYVHQQFPDIKHEAIPGAIEKAGPMREDIMNYLNRQKNK